MKAQSFDETRIVQSQEGREIDGPVVYWMDRDQRAHDNWAILHAQELAAQKNQPLVVVFGWASFTRHSSPRQQQFALVGLEETAQELESHGIGFTLLTDTTETALPRFIRSVGASALVTDFSPLRFARQQRDRVGDAIDISFAEIDAHNIVPIHVTSDKLEYAARTIRPKIHRHLERYLTDFPKLKKQPGSRTLFVPAPDWSKLRAAVPDDEIETDLAPGEAAARRQMQAFLRRRLKGYADRRNDPAADGQSNMSPYLHFGQIAPQRLALETMKIDAAGRDSEAYIEELIVRRELSDNFCYYCPQYDSIESFWNWARQSLREHERDHREYLYAYEDFENAHTHDELWNAAQIEMVRTGKMHGYMRMYWAKKILEWTPDAATALDYALRLNDQYSLDGNDPNGYTGVAWSIGGVHDRAWNERDVFGKIRYMSYGGCKRKFDVARYVERANQHSLEQAT